MTTPHSELEPGYRAVLPAEVALEFFESTVSEYERRLISGSFRPGDERLARKSIHVTSIGGRSAGGPLEITYWSPSTELTFDLLVDLGLTRRWSADLVRRRPVQLTRVERTRPWGHLGRFPS